MKNLYTFVVFLGFFAPLQSVHCQVLSEISLPPNGANERAEVSQWIGLVKVSIA